MHRPSRRWIVLALAVALPLLALALAPLLGARLVRSRGLPRLAARLGRAVTVRAVRVRWGRVELDDLAVDGAGGPELLRVPRVTVEYALLPLLSGRVVTTRVTLLQPHIEIARDADGSDNFSTVLAHLRQRGAPAEGASGGGHLAAPGELQLTDGSLAVRHAELGALEIRRFTALLRRDGACHAELGEADLHLATGPSAHAATLTVDAELADGHPRGLPALTVSGGALSIWKGFALTGIAGGITPDPADGARENVDLHGGYGGVERVLWGAKGWVRPSERQADVELDAARFDLSQLRPILIGTPVIDPEQAQVDAHLHLRSHPAAQSEPEHHNDLVEFDGRFHLAGLSVFHPMLGAQPVRQLGFYATVVGQLQPRQRTLDITRAEIRYRGLDATFTTHAEKLGKKPAFDAWLAIAPVPCQTALTALPPELTPALQGFRLQGSFQSRLHLAVDLSDLAEGVDLGGTVGIDGCEVVAAPAAAAALRLEGSFEQAAEIAPGEWLSFIVGPENPDWVPFDDISPHLVNSIMTTEDSGFMRHRGFIPSEFASALKSNLEDGYFHLGASSITMQMVKNVLLSREKTLSRKLQELFLTWYVERHLTKERILEIYFNVIEFGPGIYGIGRASRHYFGKPAKELTAREAAWFSSILPNPKRRYVHFCKGPELDQKWELYLNRILRRMHERGRLTDEDFDDAIDSQLVFDRAEAKPEKECLELVKRFTTPSPGLAARAVTDEDQPADDPQ